jgi:uncharacterized membrane protein
MPQTTLFYPVCDLSAAGKMGATTITIAVLILSIAFGLFLLCIPVALIGMAINYFADKHTASLQQAKQQTPTDSRK